MDLNQPTFVTVSELEKIGINSQKVVAEYQIKKGITLNINEFIKDNVRKRASPQGDIHKWTSC